MSELTKCNYCTLQTISYQAVCEGKEVAIRPKWNPEFDGFDVFVHPKNETPKQEHWVCWFMELGNGCGCQK